MKIEKANNGWFIEPSTDDGYKALGFLIEALKKKYCGIKEINNSEDSCLATHSSLHCPDQKSAYSIPKVNMAV